MHLAGGHLTGRPQQPGHCVGKGRLSRSGLAGQAEHLASAQYQAHVVDCVERFRLAAVVDAEVRYLKRDSFAGCARRLREFLLEVVAALHDRLADRLLPAARADLPVAAARAERPVAARAERRVVAIPAERSRGFTNSSMPKLIIARPAPTKAMHRPGGTNHHQAPDCSAESACAQ